MFITHVIFSIPFIGFRFKPKKSFGKSGKKFSSPTKIKKPKAAFVSPKDKFRKVIGPSTVEYRDTTKKFANVHTYESFLVSMYNLLCQDGNSIVDVLIDDNYEVPKLPLESSPEESRDHSKFYGASVLVTNVKTIISTIYGKLSDEYQQRVNSQYTNNRWMLLLS